MITAYIQLYATDVLVLTIVVLFGWGLYQRAEVVAQREKARYWQAKAAGQFGVNHLRNVRVIPNAPYDWATEPEGALR